MKHIFIRPQIGLVIGFSVSHVTGSGSLRVIILISEGPLTLGVSLVTQNTSHLFTQVSSGGVSLFCVNADHLIKFKNSEVECLELNSGDDLVGTKALNTVKSCTGESPWLKGI